MGARSSAEERGLGSRAGAGEGARTEQTRPQTTGLGVEGGPEPILTPPGSAGQKSELPGQRGPCSVPTQPSVGSSPRRQRGPRLDVSSVPAWTLAGQSGPGRPGALGWKGAQGRSLPVGEAAVKVLRRVCLLTRGAKRIPREALPGIGADSRASGSGVAEQRACGTPRDLSGCHGLSSRLASLIPGSRGQGPSHIGVALQGPLGPEGAAGIGQWTRHPLPGPI